MIIADAILAGRAIPVGHAIPAGHATHAAHAIPVGHATHAAHAIPVGRSTLAGLAAANAAAVRWNAGLSPANAAALLAAAHGASSALATARANVVAVFGGMQASIAAATPAASFSDAETTIL